jgi:protein O-GlcNAc transferase
MDPPHTQSFYVERLVYLPGGANCFGPPLMSPMVGPQPAKVNGFVTFGSFNVNVKISTEILTLWAEVLREIPTSRLVMKFMTGHDPQIQAHYRSQFERLGVRPERITIHGRLSPLAHLDLLTSVDIALDCFPYNGCITTSEALWMGVPVLSLAGPTFISREGLSILRRVGLEAFVTGDTQDYVARACAFAGQIEAIEQIRFSLRQRMLGSPLCNPARFAREIEQAFRTMWRTWCDSQVSDLKSQISNEGGGR